MCIPGAERAAEASADAVEVAAVLLRGRIGAAGAAVCAGLCAGLRLQRSGLSAQNKRLYLFHHVSGAGEGFFFVLSCGCRVFADLVRQLGIGTVVGVVAASLMLVHLVKLRSGGLVSVCVCV